VKVQRDMKVDSVSSMDPEKVQRDMQFESLSCKDPEKVVRARQVDSVSKEDFEKIKRDGQIDSVCSKDPEKIQRNRQVKFVSSKDPEKVQRDSKVDSVSNKTTEVDGSKDWKTAVAPGASAAEAVHDVGSAEAIGVASTAQEDILWKMNFEMSEQEYCRYPHSQGKLPNGYLPRHLLPEQISTPELYMQPFFSHQESVSSYQLPVSLVLHHPCYGYTPEFLGSTVIVMESPSSHKQASEVFKIPDHPKD
jgi:hypothetical protein